MVATIPQILKMSKNNTKIDQNSEPEVVVEYCNKCGYLDKFQELANHIEEKHPAVKIKGHEGRRGSFEVAINGTLVHSKLSTLAYPDYDDLSKIISETRDGKSTRKCKEQPITNCILC